MKINEITEGWKSALGGAALGGMVGGIPGAIIGGGLGALGLRGLDKLGGGTGDVGTAKQRAEYKQKQADKQFKKQVASYAGLGSTSTQEFLQTLRQHGVDITRQGSFNPTEIQQELKFFASHFFGSDTDPVISQYVKHQIDAEPLPNQINPAAIQQYLSTINDYRTDAITNRYKAARTVAMHNLAAQEKEKIDQAQKQVDLENLVARLKKDEQVAAEMRSLGKDTSALAKRIAMNKKLYSDITGQQPPSFAQQTQQPQQQTQQQTQQPQQRQAPQQIVTPGGVQVVSMNPIHMRYKKQDYILKADQAGNEKWVNIAGKDIPPTMADFLSRQLDTL